MQTYVEYGIFVLLIVSTIILAIRYPSFRSNLVAKVKEYEPEIVSAAYNRLPSNVKSLIDSKNFSDIISLGLEVSQEILDEKLNKGAKS